ncbi:D-arabinono-1,4-lactone oxidase [Luedemannella helvata]|uniref:D-arabinono-1,4-lactone oxidase n=1 Tax=Luedemannella helvata TaxID=349315 RepID=A0ABP4WUK6_9ACTN
MSAPTATTWRNWAGNVRADAVAVGYPASAAEVAAAVTGAVAAGRAVKAVGSGHSFTSAAATDGVRLELGRLSGVIAADADAGTVTVRAGTTLRQLNAALAALGLALPNLGDIDAQTIAGALATGTHGTGAAYGCLSTFVEALELVTADGAILRCSATEHPDVFAAARVGVGAVGVVTEVTLRCVPAFILRARERPTALADVLAGLDEWVGANDHFEFYWFPYTERTQTKVNNRVPTSDAPLPGWRRWFDDDLLANRVFAGMCRLGRALPGTVPAINAMSARALSPREYTASSHEVFVTARRVRFVEMEYGIPRAALPEAFAALRRVIDRLPYRVVFPVEVRFTAADDIWLSHGYGRDNAYLAIHQYVGMPYEEYFREFEQVCAPLGGRPHWGKMHFRDAATLRTAYPRFDDFLAVRDRLDPGRVFANSYTGRVFGT